MNHPRAKDETYTFLSKQTSTQTCKLKVNQMTSTKTNKLNLSNRLTRIETKLEHIEDAIKDIKTIMQTITTNHLPSIYQEIEKLKQHNKQTNQHHQNQHQQKILQQTLKTKKKSALLGAAITSIIALTIEFLRNLTK